MGKGILVFCFCILLLVLMVLLPALLGFLTRRIAPKVQRGNLAGLIGVPLLIFIFIAQKDTLQSLLSACFEGAGLPPVNSRTFNMLVVGAISIYMLDLFLFYTVFRLMAKAGIEVADKIKTADGRGSSNPENS